MSQRRIVVLVAALAMGAVASFLVWNYVGGVQDKADESATQVSVFLVKTQIARGTSGEQATSSGAIATSKVPRKFVPANAVTALDAISKQVAVSPLVPNQVVVGGMFVDASVGGESFAERLKPVDGVDQTAITISIDKIRGVAGLLIPGDFVNIMSVVAGTDPKAPLQDARMVLQKVEVLAIAQKAVPIPGDTPATVAPPAAGGATTTTAVAEVSPDAGLLTMVVPVPAAQVIAALPPSNMYLTLVDKDYKPVVVPPLDGARPLPGEDPAALTPYGPRGRSDVE